MVAQNARAVPGQSRYREGSQSKLRNRFWPGTGCVAGDKDLLKATSIAHKGSLCGVDDGGRIYLYASLPSGFPDTAAYVYPKPSFQISCFPSCRQQVTPIFPGCSCCCGSRLPRSCQFCVATPAASLYRIQRAFRRSSHRTFHLQYPWLSSFPS